MCFYQASEFASPQPACLILIQALKTQSVHHMSSILKIIIATLVLSVVTTAHAWWQVSATWQIGGAAPTYSATGSTREAALTNARLICKQSQPLDEYKYFCMNAPTRESYSELPGGSYVKSCANCRLEGSKLVCDSCKPKIERRELDLAQCQGEAINHIENCHGDLNCTVCLSGSGSTTTTTATKTFRGTCDKEGRNCREQP